MKKLIIFDLDGTLIDTSQGIMHCYHEAGNLLELEENPIDNEKCVIGGPLSDGFRALYKINDKDTLHQAIDKYRQLYGEIGINLFSVYDGVEQMLDNLKENGYLLAVATLKAEDYAKEILRKAGLSEKFDVICGWDGTEKCTKAMIITKVLYTLNVMCGDALLAGDSEYDAKGADAAGVDFLGVGYGFGLKNKIYKDKFIIANSPEDICDCIFNRI